MNPLANTPLPIGDVPDPVDPDLAPLLAEPFAATWSRAAARSLATAGDPGGARPAESVRQALQRRLAASREAARGMHTARRTRLAPEALAPGVVARTLYLGSAGPAARPGEPRRVRLIEMAAGSRWAGPGAQSHREWLVIHGQVRLGTEALGLRDYHVDPAGEPDGLLVADEAAWVFLRESAVPGGAEGGAFTVRDREAGWPDFAPGIQRRVLWQHAGQAALLYYAQPGARVPHHTHGHDEECLMVQGDLFLDDVLLRTGDYQIAPAGTGHRNTETDTGVVIYAHGDLDLQFVG